MLDLAGTDAKRQGTKSTVGGGVAVATDDGSGGQSKALFRANDVDNTLALVAQAKICDAKVLYIFLEGNALCARVVFLDESSNILESFSGRSWNVLAKESA